MSNIMQLTERQRSIVEGSYDVRISMPKFKARYFVGHAQITPYGAMKQYLLELASREAMMTSQQYDLDKIRLEIERQQHLRDNARNEFEMRACDIEIRFLRSKEQGFVRMLKGVAEERKIYLDLVEELNEATKLPDGTTLLDAMKDEQKCEELERDYWVKRLGKQAASDMVAYGRVGVGNIDSIMMLDGKDQKSVLSLAGDVFIRNEKRMTNILTHSNEEYEKSLLGQDIGSEDPDHVKLLGLTEE